MSVIKNKHFAHRWFETALEDMKVAKILFKYSMYASSCFHFQQAGEKALKALWYYIGEEPWGHSLQKLIEELANVKKKYNEELKDLIEASAFLDKLYIPTRYPNSLPDLTPHRSFRECEAQMAMKYAEEIIQRIREILNRKG